MADASATCKDDSVAAVYAKLYDIQNSTDVNCIKPCDSGPCQHGSICSDDADGKSYTCKCPDGFSGKNCETCKSHYCNLTKTLWTSGISGTTTLLLKLRVWS